uniref:Cytochrome P450 n=1 Tax=Rhizophagus irregularis (strain DAOM 181602 / DAOM 197198 / MUCL 43194) TaxID=747089 RepID=U9TE23_RHIID
MEGVICFFTYNNRLYAIIKERRIEIENTPLEHHDMLTSFITASTLRDINDVKSADADLLRPMTDKEIFGNILDAISAGTDSTSNLFCFIIPITYKDLCELEYCEAVIKEVYCHSPTAFFLDRMNVQSDNVGGYNWPEGTQFQMLISALLKHKDYCNEPEKFDP